MSTYADRLTPASAGQTAACMCRVGRECDSYAPGHALHLIQARLVSATPSEWIDAIVEHADRASGSVHLRTLDGDAITVWNGAGAAATVRPGEPIALHGRYHVLRAGSTQFNALRVR